jgi:hypothetical protein
MESRRRQPKYERTILLAVRSRSQSVSQSVIESTTLVRYISRSTAFVNSISMLPPPLLLTPALVVSVHARVATCQDSSHCIFDLNCRDFILRFALDNVWVCKNRSVIDYNIDLPPNNFAERPLEEALHEKGINRPVLR